MRELPLWHCCAIVSLAIAGCARNEVGSATKSEGAIIAPVLRIASSSNGGPGFDVACMGDELQAAARDAPSLGEVLTVYVADTSDDAPNVGGDVSFAADTLHFVPRHPLRPGVTYRVVFRPAILTGGTEQEVAAELTVPKPPASEPTTLSTIYPTADTLPENQLKFYLHFSAPMSRGEAYRHIHLLDASGREIEAAFLELGEELWNPQLTRFTLLCDPGRVKRGLKPREELGPVLEAGKRYTLVVDRDWIDAQGEPLSAEARKTFEVVAADESPLDTAGWKILPPQAGTRDPLVVTLPEPLDHSLLERMIAVVGPGDAKPTGTITIDEQETRWRFTPTAPWSSGSYTLVADTTLEDLAGNSIGRAFDVDVFAPVQRQIATETVSLPFEVK